MVNEKIIVNESKSRNAFSSIRLKHDRWCAKFLFFVNIVASPAHVPATPFFDWRRSATLVYDVRAAVNSTSLKQSTT